MSEITAIRSPEIIAAEINSIKAQTQKIMLQSSIEIGRRLAEAKAAVGHGNWTKWLKQSVDYSDRTAANLMRIFNEYGNGQEKLFGSSNQQAFAALNYTQAIALLGIHDEDERAEFVEKNDIDNMSTRELEKAVKERDQAKAEAEQAAKRAEKLSEDLQTEKAAKKVAEDTAFDLLAEKEKLTADKEKESQRAAELEKQLAEAKPEDKEKIKKLKKDLAEQKAKVKELNDRLAEPIKAAIVEKVPEATEEELKALHEQVEKLQAATGQEKAVLEFKTYFDIVKNDAEKLLGAIDKIENPEMKTKCRAAAGKVLDVIREQVKGTCSQ